MEDTTRIARCDGYNDDAMITSIPPRTALATINWLGKMEAFLLKSIKRLRKETPRRLKEFRLSCDELICKMPCPSKICNLRRKSIKPYQLIIISFMESFRFFIYKVTLEERIASGNRDDNANQYFSILQAGCETRVAKLMEVSLDTVHYLIGTRYKHFSS